MPSFGGRLAVQGLLAFAAGFAVVTLRKKYLGNIVACKAAKVPVENSLADIESPAAPDPELESKIDALLSYARVMLFMKGSGSEPKCKFSCAMVELLNAEQIPFSTFDILSDQSVRERLKRRVDWPTYPMLFFNGTLIGGLDVCKQLQADGELKAALGLADPPVPTSTAAPDSLVEVAAAPDSSADSVVAPDSSVPDTGVARILLVEETIARELSTDEIAMPPDDDDDLMAAALQHSRTVVI